MHEHSLMRALLAQVERIAAEHGADEVEEIVVSAGRLTGVEPLLLASAFEQQAGEGRFRAARLRIEEAPLQLVCNQCRQTFEPAGFHFACPACGAGETRVVQGDGLILRSVALRLPDPEEATP